jgi:hypothetical protein
VGPATPRALHPGGGDRRALQTEPGGERLAGPGRPQRLIAVSALDFAGGQIRSISSIANPDKLTHLGPVGDLRSLLRTAN